MKRVSHQWPVRSSVTLTDEASGKSPQCSVRRASGSVSTGGVESGHQGGMEGPVPPHSWVCASLPSSSS